MRAEKDGTGEFHTEVTELERSQQEKVCHSG
jgi:hypothetical protein